MAAALRWTDLTTLVTPVGTLTFNEASGDTYWIDPARSSPLGAGATEGVIDPKGQTDGSLVHSFFENGALLVAAGVILAPSDVSGHAGADALMADMTTKLRSILRANGTLNFGSGASLTVRCNQLPTYPMLVTYLKGFIFGVVSESVMPT